MMNQTVSFAPCPPDMHSKNGLEDCSEDEAKKRREQLNRRPSYRMILKDLETTSENSDKQNELLDDQGVPNIRPISSINNIPIQNNLNSNLNISNQQQQQQIPIKLEATSNTYTNLPRMNGNMLSNGEKLTGTLLTALSPPTGLSSSLLNNNQANLMSPMNSSELLNLKHINDTINFNNHVASIDQWSSGLMSNYGSPPNHMNSGPASASSSNMGMNEGSSGGDDTTKKRQVRLQKNREAAKECRRKKKEYVKCLEHRVTVLERQNKALIEELKALKELYCQKGKEGL